MSHVSVALALSLVLTGGSSTNGMRHIGSGASDTLLACVSRITGKPALRTSMVFGQDGFTCPADAAHLEAWLAARQLRLVQSDTAVVVFSVAYPDTLRVLLPTVTTRAMAWAAIPGSRAPSQDELSTITGVVEREARPLPVLVTEDDPGPPPTSRITFDLRVDVHRLRPGVESVVAIWGYVRGTARVVYGENGREGYRGLWDSPLLRGNAGLGYYDVTGDDVAEIIRSSPI